MRCCTTSTRAPGAARGDVSDSRPDAAGQQRLVRDGSARSIRSSNPGASGAALDTRRGLLGPASVVWSPYEHQALRRRRRAKSGRLHVSGVPLLAEETRERRLDRRSSRVTNTPRRGVRWIHRHARARRARRGRRPPCRALRGERHAPRHACQLHRSRRRHRRRPLKLRHRVQTPASERIAPPVAVDARRPVRQDGARNRA